jgi:hypothetical protein
LFQIIPIILLLQYNATGDPQKMQDRLWLLERYEHTETRSIIDTVKADLLSKDFLVQDAACIVLLKTLDGLKKNNKKSDSIFTSLSIDQKVIVSVCDIVESKLLGWYNPDASYEIDDDIRIYAPLFIILSKSDSKIAQHTLSKSLLYLRNHDDVLELIDMREALASYAIRRLGDIKSKYCCIYPGKETVVDMLEKDYRYRILVMFETTLKSTIKTDSAFINKTAQYVTDCLKYGDSKNGYVIRIKAANIAGILIAKGVTELTDTLKKLSTSDPFYVHVYLGKFGFSLTELNYPVREACRIILNK